MASALRVSARLSTEFQGDYPTFPVLKSMGWRYFNGTGLVSHYYLPPECTAKKAAELEGLTEGIHFFTSEDDVKAFWAQKKTTECGIIPGAATFSKASTVENNVLKQGPQNLVLKVVRPSKPHTIDSENRSKVAKGGINHRSTKSLEMSKKMRTLQDITNTSASSSYDNRISAKRKKTDDNNGTDFKVNSSQTEPLAYDSSQLQIFPIQVDDKQLVAFVHDLARNPSSTPLYQTILKSIKIEQGIAFTLVDMGGLWDRLGFIFGHMALSRDMHVCYIDLVFVYNMIRGNGFARKLYMKLEEEAIHRAKSMGAASLTMQIVMKPCLEHSSAFWETMGFAGNTLLMEKYLSWS